MGYQPAKNIPKPDNHYQTREQTALFKVLAKFWNDDYDSIVRRFWWICPDGNVSSPALAKEIQRLRQVSFEALGVPVKPPSELSMERLLR